jgi:N-acetylmuramic acid 6-phosphate etherase
MSRKSHRRRALEFLRVAHLYRLGDLTTEQPHPETGELSHWARNDLPRAISVLKSVDLRALKILELYAADLDRLAGAVQETLARGNRIFLCGCGATGRLALTLEFLWNGRSRGRDRVRSFMAGGDVALVHALEGFEDYPRYGARHLRQMGFADGDLLIGCTEGGETPYVIGATEEAARISSNRPYFLYCNADGVLAARVERFRRVRDNPNIHELSLHVGPMALTGSTRMQASTVLQLAVGVALLYPGEPARSLISRYCRQVRDTDFSFLADFVEQESDVYLRGDHVIYRIREFGITVLTDTTERAPTFSLVPFDRPNGRRVPPSLCYVSLEDAKDSACAWRRLLNREPRCLDWPAIDPRTTSDYLRGFDFSADVPNWRRRRIPGRTQEAFHIGSSSQGIELRLGRLEHQVTTHYEGDLFRHLLLKQMLNIHSTLVMGRLGRYENNLMTWVRPTNGKLVDRAARYVQHLLAGAGASNGSYEEIVCRLFAEMARARPGESVVLRTYRSLSNRAPAHLGPGQTMNYHMRKGGSDHA